jgi:hypothetical protein
VVTDAGESESLTLFPPRGPIRAGEKRALQLELAHHSGRAPVRARRRHRREGARVAMTRANGRRRVKKRVKKVRERSRDGKRKRRGVTFGSRRETKPDATATFKTLLTIAIGS